MVDVGAKPVTQREAVAEAVVTLGEAARSALAGGAAKGDAVAVAELAGIMGAKRTADLIPLCHPIALTHVSVTGTIDERSVRFEARCATSGQTGVEMEALVAASTAALTLYDMLKGVDRGMSMETRLISKAGGRSGTWQRA
jgi:cyclic pyranopterin phosphate synthase